MKVNNKKSHISGDRRPALTTFLRHWRTTIALVLLRVMGMLPLTVSRAIGRGLGFLLYITNAKRRRIARINLALCFPELPPPAVQRLLRRHFGRAGQAYLDIGFLAWAGESRFRRAVRLHGIEHLAPARAAGRRIILLAPHGVGMNVGGIAVAREHAVFSMVKRQRNPLVNWVLNKARSRYGSPLIERDQGLRRVVRALQSDQMFYYLPDEDLGPRHSVFAPFFGIPTATLDTLGRLARLTDAAVVPCFTRLVPGGYDIYLMPALSGFPSGDAVADATHMNRVIEAEIRAVPEQYMWTFKFFKTRPDGARSPYDA